MSVHSKTIEQKTANHFSETKSESSLTTASSINEINHGNLFHIKIRQQPLVVLPQRYNKCVQINKNI